MTAPRHSPTTTGTPRVVIVGGGWAGLSAAVSLAAHGIAPVLLESARQLGGRARALRFGLFHVDNGQHMLLGAFEAVLDMLNTLGISEASVFRRQSLRLLLCGAENRRIELRTERLPAPLHFIVGLVRSSGISLSARFAAIRLLRVIARERPDHIADISVADFLLEHRQPFEIVKALWAPYCYAALNSSPDNASARIFLSAARRTFFGHRRHSDLLLPILDLSACLPRPATDYIESHGGSVRLGARVQAIEVNEGAVTGVQVDGTVVPAEHVVLATPHEISAELLEPHPAAAALAAGFRQLSSQPICTVYLRYADSVTLERDMIGLVDALPQWLFDRGRLMGDHGLIAAVISGPGAHVRLTNEALIGQVIRDVARSFPDWPAPIDAKLVRERRATLAALPGVDEFRPKNTTAIKGLWLAGDYTAIGYPSTLEAAVRSGVRCARWIRRHTAGAESPPIGEETDGEN